uniref:Uncharacterized protein n=1 Tax=Arundo donax TaxID=35708 RepID=A0A0A9HUX0_ARUDO
MLIVLHMNTVCTSKLPRMSPTNLACANGEISQYSLGIAPYSFTELVGTHTCEVDWLKPQDSRYNNGVTGCHYSEERVASVSTSGYDSNKGYLKPLHPDTKYQSQVHSIGAVDDFPEYIDQDWLFPEDPVERKTPSFEAAESHQVWSDAQTIGTVDIIALPYVVPL